MKTLNLTLNLTLAAALCLATAGTLSAQAGFGYTPPAGLVNPNSPAAAQPGSKSGGFSRNVGNSDLGCGIECSASVVGTNSEVKAEAVLKGTISVLGETFDAAVASAKATTNTGTHAKFVIKAAGITLYSQRVTDPSWGDTIIKTKSKTQSKNFMVGPVPVTVNGTVGISGKLSYAATLNVLEQSVRLDGKTRTWAYGSVSCGVGWSMASVGVIATLNFADQRIEAVLAADTNGVAAALTYDLIPVALSLGLYVDVDAWIVDHRWTVDLYNYSCLAYHSGNLLN